MPKSEEWRRDSKKEKSLLERSVQNTSVKEKHWVTEYRYSSNKDRKLQYEPLFFCACTCTVQVRFLRYLTGVKSLPGFGAGAVCFNNFQDLRIFFQSSCTWQRKDGREKKCLHVDALRSLYAHITACTNIKRTVGHFRKYTYSLSGQELYVKGEASASRWLA